MKSKGSIFLILFSIIMLHMVVDIVFAIHKSEIVIEKVDQNKTLASELGHSDEDVTLNEFFSLDPYLNNGQRINLPDFNFQNQFHISFWRPPKLS